MKPLTIFFAMVCLHTAAKAVALMPITDKNVIYGDVYNIYSDTVIAENISIQTDSVNIRNSLYLQNLGDIQSDIYVSDNMNLVLQNSGFINGSFYIGKNASITQLIKKSEDINNLGINSGSFSVVVQSDECLRLADIINISGYADKIILDNSMISIEDDKRPTLYSTKLLSPEIELVGEINIAISDPESFSGKAIMTNVSGNGIVNVKASNIDPLNAVVAKNDNGNIYLELVRQTDYTKIFSYDYGKFINNLRHVSPNSKIVTAMDSATSMSDLQKVMNKSVIFNPINLMTPIKAFNKLNITDRFEDKDNSMDIEPVYVFTNGSNLYANKAKLHKKISDYKFSITGYMGEFETDDQINEFTGRFYGFSLRSLYDAKTLWIDSTLAYTNSRFNIKNVFNGGNSIDDPSGNMINGYVDVGTNFDLYDVYISAFSGVGGEYESVLNQSENELFLRAGTAIGYRAEDLGIKYNYQIFANVQTDNVQSIGAKIGFWSVEDFVGGNLSYSIMNSEYGEYNMVSAEVSFMF